MEQIFIRDLQVYGYHGVYSQEKEQGQHFLVQARADLSFARAAASDELGETVDYGSLCLLMARGAIISMVVVVLMLPSMYMLFDKLICKTTLGLRKTVDVKGGNLRLRKED